MVPQAVEANRATVSVEKSDLIHSWSMLEKLVVSLRKMGSHYAIPSGQSELPSERHAEMLAELDRFLSPELVRELSKCRSELGKYLDNEEAEAISERLEFWSRK